MDFKMKFECVEQANTEDERWEGTITKFTRYQNHYEIKIESRSSIMVLFGRTSRGAFACIPDFGVGCHLVDLKDRFWNTEQLTGLLGKVDGITVATALYTLADKIKIG